MNQPHLPLDKKRLQQVRQTLDASAENISYVEQYQLRQIRRQALSQQASRPLLKWFLVSGLMALCLFVFWSLQVPGSVDARSGWYVEGGNHYATRQPWQEKAGLLENLEFMAWLYLESRQESAVLSQLEAVVMDETADLAGEPAWDRLSDGRKAALRAAFARFDALDVSAQQGLREVFRRYSALPSGQQHALRQTFDNLAVQQRQNAKQMLFGTEVGQ